LLANGERGSVVTREYNIVIDTPRPPSPLASG
jgi:hypothetical protein